MKNYLLIFGTNPELSLLELTRVLENDFSKTENNFTLIQDNIVNLEIDKNFNIEILQDRLGGLVKIVEIITEVEQHNIKLFKTELDKIKEEKVVFGFSLYSNLDKKQKQFERMGLELKKDLKAEGKKVRLVTSKEPELSSVIVQKEILKKNGIDFVLVPNNNKTIIGITKTVQDFKTYSQLDYGRPRRDAFSGMLPPKLARMMVNIAAPQKGDTLLDPFCGSGTVIQEAGLLLNANLIGTDVSKKAVLDSRSNMEWLREKYPRKLKSTVFSFKQVDAKKIATEIKNESVDIIVTEVYLGPVKGTINIPQQKAELEDLYKRIFKEFQKILKKGAHIVVAFPAWRSNNEIIHLDIKPSLEKQGYKFFAEPILYGREDARVLRDIYFMEY
ncbi:MAG: DNA methyltransferase [Patescibacteria group bacterium]|nr:methyltransferase domain-containing protein [Patescibacteria group bacterium]